MPEPARNGYTFNGWYESSGLTGNAVTTIAANSTGNKTYYAKWTAIAYGITYTLNGGVLTGQQTTYTVVDLVVLATPTRSGYEFGGWFVNADFSGSAVASVPAGSTGEKAFYAKWTVRTYGITYNLNSGTLSGQKTSYTTEDESYTLPEPEYYGYNFDGWFIAPDYSGSPVTLLQSGSTGDKTYYAKWTIKRYTVTFYVDGEVYTEMEVSHGTVFETYTFLNEATLREVKSDARGFVKRMFNLAIREAKDEKSGRTSEK